MTRRDKKKRREQTMRCKLPSATRGELPEQEFEQFLRRAAEHYGGSVKRSVESRTHNGFST